MSTYKFTPHDRMLVAALIDAGVIAGPGELHRPEWAVKRADALLTELAGTKPPGCVDADAGHPSTEIARALNFWLQGIQQQLGGR